MNVNVARLHPRKGGYERLSGSEMGDSKDAAKKSGGRSSKASTSDNKSRKQRTGDLGRALRTVYDDTLREQVPDDFMDLLGKLS